MAQNTSKLKALREQFKLTQTEIGDRLGCSQQFIAQVEAGQRPLPDDMEVRLEEVREELRAKREADLALMRKIIRETPPLSPMEIAEELNR